MSAKLLRVFIVFFITIVFVFNFAIKGEQQFSFLAESLLQGKSYFEEIPGSWYDTSFFESKFYWPLGPFPSLLLLPFVYFARLFGSFFHQGFLQVFLVFGVFFLVYKIALKLNYSRDDSLFLALSFCMASAFLGVSIVPWSWYFSQVVTVFLLLLIIFEYLTRKRLWLLGAICGFVLLTRITASFVILFFILDIILAKGLGYKNKLSKIINLAVPYTSALLVFFLYNFLRFGDPLEQGYSMQIIPEYASKAREYGVFSLLHLPGNLYYFLLATPLPVFKDGVSHVLRFPYLRQSFGMSIFVTSPYLLKLFFFKYNDRFSKMVLATVFIIATPILLYYGIGWRQLGYRYQLDFFPLVFWLFMVKYKNKNINLSGRLKTLIILASLFNLYLFFFVFLT